MSLQRKAVALPNNPCQLCLDLFIIGTRGLDVTVFEAHHHDDDLIRISRASPRLPFFSFTS